MVTAFLACDRCRLHDMGAGHPEQPARLDAIVTVLKTRGLWARLRHYQAPEVSREQLLRVHDVAYVDEIEARAPSQGVVFLDGDTSMVPHSLGAAHLAAGAVVLATDLVLGGEVDNAFCSVRPPGHHAETNRAMGFCIFNNVAVGVVHALDYHGLQRVAVVDFDVHHGNGTEDIFKDRDDVLLCSTFQHPFYPYSDARSTSSRMVKIPLAAGSHGDALRQGVVDTVLPALQAFQPEMVFFSAGFDAHRADPLANLCWTDDDYVWLTRAVMNATAPWSRGRCVSSLEGGYDLTALGRAAAAHIGVLLDTAAGVAGDVNSEKL